MTENPRPLTPEEVIRAMAPTELQELLRNLALEASLANAYRLRHLVLELDSFEAAIEQIGGLHQ
ncbi:MAG: hypothetical protein VYA84_14015 [Planctomycetota bacterium]|nr:hypothetical protein [Planctomycetota bacterium]